MNQVQQGCQVQYDIHCRLGFDHVARVGPYLDYVSGIEVEGSHGIGQYGNIAGCLGSLGDGTTGDRWHEQGLFERYELAHDDTAVT